MVNCVHAPVNFVHAMVNCVHAPVNCVHAMVNFIHASVTSTNTDVWYVAMTPPYEELTQAHILPDSKKEFS
jgi:hypothetical protein